MPVASLVKNEIREFKPKYKLRDGQNAAAEWILDNPKADKLFLHFPTGYGKTLAFLVTYLSLCNTNRVNRALIVVPSSEQFSSYIRDLENDCHEKLRVRLSGVCQANELYAIKDSQSGKAEVFITTYQALLSPGSFELVRKMMSLGHNWLLALDEVHRTSDINKWGGQVKNLPYEFCLGLTATPERSDRVSLPIIGSPDIVVTLKEALEEDAIRPVRTHVRTYYVDVDFVGEGEPERVSEDDVDDYVARLALEGKNVTKRQILEEARYYDQYVCPLITDAVSRLNAKNAKHPDQHQMLVFALSCKHAEHLCKVINKTHGEGFADWIGTQSTINGSTYGRPDKINNQIIERYKDNKLKCLVQVWKAAEGFNCVRASVAVFLNIMNDTPRAWQAFGRVLRRNGEIIVFGSPGQREDIADIYITSSNGMANILKSLDDLVLEEYEGEDVEASTITPPSSDESSDIDLPVIHSIPDFFLIGAQIKQDEIYWSIDGEKVSQSQVAETLSKKEAFKGMSQSDLLDIARQTMTEELGLTPRIMSRSEQCEQARKKCNEVCGALAYNAVRIICHPNAFEPSKIGLLKKKINTRWKRARGAVSENTLEELEMKYRWIQDLNENMKLSGEVEKWMRP
ncbi:MAG: DEAD/DEAH box helicase family protein [Cyanobacteria bacterium P01_H01_bin.105]